MRRSRRNLCAMVCGALLLMAIRTAVAAPVAVAAAAADHEDFISALWRRANERLTRASAELEPPLVPPVPINVKWRARRVASVDLAAPLLAMAAGDLDGDRRAELVALTTREVVVLRLAGKRKLTIAGRAPLPATAPSVRPRDAVGAVVVVDLDGDGKREVLARASDSSEGASYAWQDGRLKELGPIEGFPLGANAFADLEPGRNYFVAARTRWPSDAPAIPERFYSAERRDDLVDPTGRAQWAIGFATPDGELLVRLHTRCRVSDGGSCHGSRVAEVGIADAGVAFEIADVNRDGLPEAIISSSGAPGDPDRATVLTLHGTRADKLFRRKFSGGIVGLAAADLDGNGDLEVVAAVRLLGSHRVDVWTLN